MALNDSFVVEEINKNSSPYSFQEDDDSVSKVAGISIDYKSKEDKRIAPEMQDVETGNVKRFTEQPIIEECYASRVEGKNSGKSSDRSQDTYIHEFQDQFQKLADVRKKLASRKDKIGSVKRVVVPTYIKNSPDMRSETKQSSSDYDDNLKAASVAASAAIAATQPLVKAQQDLEQQVSILNNRLKNLDDLSRYCANINPTAIEELNAAELRLQALMQDDVLHGEWTDTHHMPPPHPPPLQQFPIVHPCLEEDNLASLHAARKLDSLERLQKQQIANQDRLISLTKRMDDRAEQEIAVTELCIEKSKPTAHPVTLVDNKGRKKKNNFLKKIVKQDELRRSMEEIASPIPSFPQGTSSIKALNQEIDIVREEFNDQLNEIKQSLAKSKRTPAEPITPIHKNTHYSSDRVHVDRCDVACPLDQYLCCQHPPAFTFGGPLPGHLVSVAQAMSSVPGVSECIDAEAVLNEVSLRRANLENNMEAVIRTKEGQVIYSLIDLLQRDETSAEKARMRAMIDDAIQQMDKKVSVEVASEWQRLKLQKQLKQHPTVSAPCSRAYMRSTLARKLAGPSESEKPRRPTAGKYPHTKAKIDTGRLLARDRSPSPPMKSRDMSPPPYTTNRRTVKTPYLHFVNELKTARRALLPLQEVSNMAEKPRAASVRFESPTPTKDRETRVCVPPAGIIPLGVRQYSVVCEHVDNLPQASNNNVQDEQYNLNERKTVELANLQTQTEPTKENVSMQTSPLKDVEESPSSHPDRSRDHLRMSEEGAGLQLPGYRESSPNRGTYSDPLQQQVQNRLEDEILARVLTTLAQQRERKQEPQQSGDYLRELIEEALQNEIMEALHHFPRPKTPRTEPVIKVTTPPVSSRSSSPNYSEEFESKKEVEEDEENDILNRLDQTIPSPDEKSITYRDDVATPLPSSLERSRYSPTPSLSKIDKSLKHAAAQTEIHRQLSPSPVSEHLSPVEVTPRVTPQMEDNVSSSEASIETETYPNTFSDGMWLIDRSEGEAPDFPVNTKERIQLGDYPPLDSKEFDLTTEIHTNPSHPSEEGEFCHAAVKGHPAVRDPMLNLLARRNHLIGDGRVFATPEYDSFLQEMNQERFKMPHPARMRSPPRHRHRDEPITTLSTKSPGETSFQRGTFDFEDDRDVVDLQSSFEQPPKYPRHSGQPKPSSVSPAPKIIQVSESKRSLDPQEVNELRTTAGTSLGTHDTSLLSDTGVTDPRMSFGDVNYSDSATGGLTTNQIIADALCMTGGTTMDISDESGPPGGEQNTRKLLFTGPHLDTVKSEYSDQD